MRPTTPNFNFAQQAGPSSPPTTPTATNFTFSGKSLTGRKARRQGIPVFDNFPPITPNLHSNGGTITPHGSGTTFSYNRFEPLNLSPRSSSPASSRDSSSSEADSHPPPRSRSSSPNEPISESPPKPKTRIKVVTEGNFTVEEFRESDYEDLDSDASVIRPHQYEDAESEAARSARATSPFPRHDLDPGVVNGLRDLDCGSNADPEDAREIWFEKQREDRRRKRRSSGSVQKRTLAQSIGSDTDDEDLQPVLSDANEAGSSARRLRRKVAGERTSLIFDDPPVGRIEEEEEPESCEEVVEVEYEDEDDDRQMPSWLQDMEVDSDDND